MPCALCKQDRELRNSHVIPEFIYAPLYDHKHRFHLLSSGPRSHAFGQKGMRERILCADCEEQFSKHEKYASDVFAGRIRVESSQKGNLVRIAGLDYPRFKLFALSVLWRAGVSSLPMFSKVQLGPHQEPLRDQLARDDPGPSARYGVFLSPLINDDGEDQKAVIVQPTRSRLGNHLCYRFVFGGLIWVFLVSKHSPPRVFRDAFVNERGEMLMLVSEVSEVSFILNGLKNVFRAQAGSA